MSDTLVDESFEKLREILQRQATVASWNDFIKVCDSAYSAMKQAGVLDEFHARYHAYIAREVERWPLFYRRYESRWNHAKHWSRCLSFSGQLDKQTFARFLTTSVWKRAPWKSLEVIHVSSRLSSCFMTLELMRKMPHFKGCYIDAQRVREDQGTKANPGLITMLHEMIDAHGETLEALVIHIWGMNSQTHFWTASSMS